RQCSQHARADFDDDGERGSQHPHHGQQVARRNGVHPGRRRQSHQARRYQGDRGDRGGAVGALDSRRRRQHVTGAAMRQSMAQSRRSGLLRPTPTIWQMIAVLRLAMAGCLAAGLAACSTLPMAPSVAVSDLAPTGKLRAAINFGNPVLAAKDPSTGEARGVSVDLARELARRLNVPLEIVPYTAAGQVVEDLKSGAWDVAYLAIDPA